MHPQILFSQHSNRQRAESLVPFARVQMDILGNLMDLGNLETDVRRVRFHDGAFIVCVIDRTSPMGVEQKKILIHAPVDTKKDKEKRIIPGRYCLCAAGGTSEYDGTYTYKTYFLSNVDGNWTSHRLDSDGRTKVQSGAAIGNKICVTGTHVSLEGNITGKTFVFGLGAIQSPVISSFGGVEVGAYAAQGSNVGFLVKGISGGSAGILRTTDWENYTETAYSPTVPYFSEIVGVEFFKDKIFVAEYGVASSDVRYHAVQCSADNGDTWQTVFSGGPWEYGFRGLAVIPDRTILWMGSYWDEDAGAGLPAIHPKHYLDVVYGSDDGLSWSLRDKGSIHYYRPGWLCWDEMIVSEAYYYWDPEIRTVMITDGTHFADYSFPPTRGISSGLKHSNDGQTYMLTDEGDLYIGAQKYETFSLIANASPEMTGGVGRLFEVPVSPEVEEWV
jgi:hypothetical protein